MIKQTPTIGRIIAMVVFALSCFGILLFLWLSFGGSIPLKPQGYRFKAPFPEAATLAQEADVRLAGVNIGKVKKKTLDKGAARTLVEMELESKFAPIPRDTRAILRQKTLLGETYVELAPGTKGSGDLPDGATLAKANIEPTVELDEIFNVFDPPTRRAFRAWQAGLAKAIEGGRGQDLNDALGNLEGFAVDGADLLRVLDEQEVAVRRLVRNTGRVFGAINEREGALRQLIVNSNNTFEATASRDEALAEAIRIFPTFLDESRVTLARLERFARNTHPLVRDLRPVADDLGPTVRDLGDLAPDLERLFRALPALIRASADDRDTAAPEGFPAAEAFIRGARPVFRAAHTFFPEFNPIIAYLQFHQETISQFLASGGAALAGPGGCNPEAPRKAGPPNWGGAFCQTPGPGNHSLPQLTAIDVRTFESYGRLPTFDRGNAYPLPNFGARGGVFGVIESFRCPRGDEQRNPDREVPHTIQVGPIAVPHDHAEPPCFQIPDSLFPGGTFPKLGDFAGLVDAPVRGSQRGGDGLPRLPAGSER